MKLQLMIVSALVATAAAAEEPKCPLAGEWELDPLMSDEFDGEGLDKAKCVV